jgi:hypothetical protein
MEHRVVVSFVVSMTRARNKRQVATSLLISSSIFWILMALFLKVKTEKVCIYVCTEGKNILFASWAAVNHWVLGGMQCLFVFVGGNRCVPPTTTKKNLLACKQKQAESVDQ